MNKTEALKHTKIMLDRAIQDNETEQSIEYFELIIDSFEKLIKIENIIIDLDDLLKEI